MHTNATCLNPLTVNVSSKTADHINKQISGSLLKAAIPLQAILDFCNQPGFVHEVFMNLDCRIERSNLFEAICTLLSKAAFPVGSTLGSVHLLSLEGIHSILAALASRSALIPRTASQKACHAATIIALH